MGWLPLAQSPTDAAQTTAFLARTSGLSGTETAACKALINGLVSDTHSAGGSIFSHLDALYIFATNNTTTAALNLVSTSFGLTATTGGTPPTFLADHGYTGQGSQSLDTGIILTTGGLNFQLNSGSIGVYNLNNRTTTASTYAMGVTSASGGVQLSLLQTSGILLDINDLSFPFTANTGTQGLWHGSRTAASGAGCMVLYKNGSVFGSYSTASGTVPITNSLYILARNNIGTLNNPVTDQLSAAWVGGGFSSSDITAFSNRLNAYMTALGINVF